MSSVIIYFFKRKEAQLKPFDGVKEEIRATLTNLFEQEKTTAYVDEAMKKAGVKFYYDRVVLE